MGGFGKGDSLFYSGSMMDSFRYYLALVLLVVIPGAFLFCLSVHSFIRFWRRVGYKLTYACHFTAMTGIAIGLFLVCEPLLSVQFGTSRILIVLAIPVYSMAVMIARRRREQIGVKVLLCLPELAPQKYQGTLVTKGIYSRVRHPRYLELLLFLLGYALVANYLAVYVLFLLSVVAILLVVRLEERELRSRFGKEYEKYCERVPPFIPRL